MTTPIEKTQYRLTFEDGSERVIDTLRNAFASLLKAPDFALPVVTICEEGPVAYRNADALTPIVVAVDGNGACFSTGHAELEFRWEQANQVLAYVLLEAGKAIDPATTYPRPDFAEHYNACNAAVVRFFPDHQRLRDLFSDHQASPGLMFQRLTQKLMTLGSPHKDGMRYEVPLPENYAWAPYGGMVLTPAEAASYNRYTRDICRAIGGGGGIEVIRDKRHQYVRECYLYRQDPEWDKKLRAEARKAGRQADDTGPSF
jgi:hypothetical protein